MDISETTSEEDLNAYSCLLETLKEITYEKVCNLCHIFLVELSVLLD